LAVRSATYESVRGVRSRSAVAAVLAAALLAMIGVLGSAIPASAEDGFGGGPSDGDGPDRRTAFLYQIDPGQHLEDSYYIKNSGTTAQNVTVFATDAFTADDGSYAFLDTATEATDGGSWVSFEGGAKRLELTLAPGELRTIPFTVDVPADATPGDHAAGILVAAKNGSGEVLVERRVATRMYVRVSGDLQAALAVTDISGSYEAQLNPFDGGVLITVKWENVGNIAISADVVAGVNGPFGIGVAVNEVEHLSQLLPGEQRIVTYAVPGVAQLGLVFPYIKAVPQITDELRPVEGMTTRIERDVMVPAVPWWLVILIGIAAVIVVIVVWRRRVDLKRAREWMAWTEEEAARKAAEDRVAAAGSADRSR
jgi:dihydroorotate dehydrogenase (fumarate)